MRYEQTLVRRLRALLACGLLVFPALGVYAQTTGEVTGVVKDSSGAILPGATVTITNTATQQVRSAVSNDTGIYVLPFLLPGIYNVRAEKAGFKAVTNTNVNVEVGATVNIDFSMEVGAITQSVQVTSAEGVLATQSVSLGTVIETKQITDLPLNGRDYLDLVSLSPNVESEAAGGAGGGLQGGVRASVAISVAGQRQEFNHYTLDGVENTDMNFASYIIHPSIDAIQEFRVQTGVYSAEFGTGASQVNVTTKSGSNAYHFVAFEFLRNDFFDAEQWRQVGKKNPFRRNEYGFTLSGPITIPKLFNGEGRLFFMSNFENDVDKLTEQLNSSVPTLKMRSGDFSASGIPQIYEPWTRVTVVGGGSATPFPGNIIPQNEISPQALALLNYVPVPTYPGDNLLGPNGTGNYLRQAVAPTTSMQFNQRIDWTESQKSSWFGRFSWGNDFTTSPSADIVGTTNIPTTVRQAVVGNTYIISPTMVNEASFSWSQFNNSLEGYYSNKFNVQATLGIDGLVAPSPVAYAVPSVGLSMGVSSYGGGSPYITRDQIFQGVDSLSIVKGKHSLKVGGAIRRDRYNEFGNQKASGEVDFDGASTNDPANPTKSGYTMADFMTGYLSQYYRVVALANGQLRRTDYAAFIQDDWKVEPKLTLNLGLRYENVRPWVDKYDQMWTTDLRGGIGVTTGPWGGYGTTPVSTLTPNTPNVIATRPGSGDFYQGVNFRYANNTVCNEINFCDSQQVQRGNQYLGRSLVKPNNFNYGPRVGVSYSPTNKWVFRGGFGIFFAQDVGNPLFDQARNLGGKDGTPVSVNSRTVQLSSPWATEASTSAVNCPGWSGACLLAPQIQTFNSNNRTEYVEQYLFDVQRQLTPRTALDLNYLGNQGHHLSREMLFNQAVPKSGPNDPTSFNQRQPFPAYGNFQTVDDVVNANYNGLSVRLQQQVSHGLIYLVAFTWAKAIDDGSAIRPDGDDDFIPVNTYNLHAERGVSEFNIPHRFVASFLYELPFGRGKAFVSQGLLSRIVGGWQVGGIVKLVDGNGWSFGELADLADLGTPYGNAPDYTGISPIPAHRSASEFWNKAAVNTTNSNLTYTMGTMGRNTLSTPGTRNLDSSLTKGFHLWEAHTLTFRFELFNTFNHPNWSTPSASPTSSSFGVVTGAGTMRQMQFALKYSF